MSKLEMIDLTKLQEKLTLGFIHREYQILSPQMTANYLEDAIREYKNNTLFRARVDSVVASVLNIIETHDKAPIPPSLKIIR